MSESPFGNGRHRIKLGKNQSLRGRTMKETMTKTNLCGGTILLAIALWLLPDSVLAQSAWTWQMSLRVAAPGDAMYMPAAVSFDRDSERYYAVDAGRNRLVSFSRTGEMLRAFNAGDQLKAPFDMVRLDNGQLWVVEKGRNSLTLVDVAAREVKPHSLRDGAKQVFPDRIAQDGGNLYVLDRAGGEVLRLNPDLTVAQHFGCTECKGGFIDFVIDRGSVWALEPQGRKIFHFRTDGGIDKTMELGDRVAFPVSLALEPTGSVYVLDRHRNRVAVFAPDGRFQYSFLGPGQGRAQLNFPRELRFDPWERLCIVDEGNGRVEVFGR